MSDDGGPAFPVPDTSGGMSLRDWFAGQAMARIVHGRGMFHAVAKESYQMADAMLKAREEVNAMLAAREKH